MKQKTHDNSNLIDKKTVALIFGYKSVLSVNNLIARHPDFPRPVVSAIGRGNKSMWGHSEIAAWYKKHQQNQQLAKLQQAKEQFYMRKSVAKNLIADAMDKVSVMVEVGTVFGKVCDTLNNIKRLPEALDTSVAFHHDGTDYFNSNAAALVDVLSDTRLNKPRAPKKICKYGEIDFYASVIDHPIHGRGYSCRIGEPAAYTGAADMIGFYGPAIIQRIETAAA